MHAIVGQRQVRESPHSTVLACSSGKAPAAPTSRELTSPSLRRLV